MMEAEKQFKKEWKNELESNIYLNTEMKSELVEKVVSHKFKEKKQSNLVYPLVFSIFVFGIAFFLLVTIQDNTLGISSSSNTSFSTEYNFKELLVSERFYWTLGAILIEGTSVFLLFAVIKKTLRWQTNTFISKINSLLATWPRNFVIQSIIFILIGGRIAFISLNIIKILVVFFVMLLNCLLLLWFVRKLNRSACPHCGKSFTRKDVFKMTWAPYRLTCIRCEENIYLSADSRKNSVLFIWVPLISHYLLALSGIPIQIIVFSFIVVGLFFNFYIVNFTNRFSNEDEPLW